MRLPILLGGALALALQVVVLVLALMFPTSPAFGAEGAKCDYTLPQVEQELTASDTPFTILVGESRDGFTQALAAAIKLETGQDVDMSRVTRVLIVEFEHDLFFGLELADGCLTAPMPLATFFPPIPRSGRDALGTHA